MKDIMKGLQPARVWHWFGEIMQIPRPSKHEERISAYLVKWGEEHGLETKSDKLGNVLIRKPATKGYEKCASRPTWIWSARRTATRSSTS